MGRRLEACDLSRGVRGWADEAASKGETFAADTAASTGERELFVAAGIF